MAGDLIDLVKSDYSTFSKGQKRIADYILIHTDRAVRMTAAKLAREANVSESTVVRFAAEMGFDGYPKMQRALQEVLRARLTAVQRIEYSEDIPRGEVLETVLKSDVQNIKKTLGDVDHASFEAVVEGLLGARRIYIIGLRSSAPIAQFFGHYLSYIIPDVHMISGGVGHVVEELLRVGEGDWVFAISFPRYSKRTVEGARFAKQNGAMVASMTDSPASPLAEVSDYNLFARSDMAFFADSLVAPMSVINALIVALGLARKKEVSEYLNRLEHVWDETEAYIGADKEHDND